MSSQERAQTDQLLRDLRAAVPGTEQLFDAVVGALNDAVTIRDRDNRIVYANRAALEHMGFASWAAMRDVPPGRIMADYDVTDEDGQPVTMDEIPSVRLLRGEEAEPLLIRTVHRQTGAVHWNLLKASPLRSSDGTIEATITTIEDVTEQRLAQLRAAYLARAASVLASSLDYEQTLQNVAELAVPAIADWCGVDLVGPRGERVPVAVAHVDPARLQLARELRRYEPARPNPEGGVAAVLRTGEPLLYPEVTDDMLQGAALDSRHLELLRSVGMRSVAIVPVRTGSHTLGTMTLVNAESGRVLQEDDVQLASQIAERAAVAIENARLYSERSRIAHTLQQSLRPEPLPDVPGYAVASLYLPAVDGSEVGGDFYELWEVDEGWLLVVGDVTGKGVEAAVLTSLARHTLRTASEFVSSPAALLARLDRTLRAQPQPSICTALCVRLEPERLVLASGGHPLPLMVSPAGVEQLGTPGPLLGAFPDAQLTDIVARFPPEATLIAYTDGVTDAVRPDGERFGLERLLDALDRCRECSAQQVIETLSEALERFGAGRHVDDTAAVVLRRSLPAGVAAAETASASAAA
jgi:PAS domain S-box-containing protein